MIPMLRQLPQKRAERQLEWIGQRARKLVVGLMLLLLGSGLVNLHRIGLLNLSEGWSTNYGITVGIKVTLALGLFLAFPVIMILAHRRGSDDLESRLRRMDRLHWGITAVTLVIMFLGVLLRT
jgi:hypothetical protein